MVLDPGDEPNNIITHLERAGTDVSHILLTHGHYDHLGAVRGLRDRWPDAELAIHPEDRQWLGEGALSRHLAFFRSLGAVDLVNTEGGELPEPSIFLDEGTEISGWRVLHTPGHSPGSVCLYNEQRNELISGDTLFCEGEGRTDGPGGSRRQLEVSLSRLLTLPPETIVYPGHGACTSIGRERLIRGLP